MGDTGLCGAWTLYFHDPSDMRWTLDSYKRVTDVTTVQDWVQLDACCGDMWENGAFFLMRAHIKPMWEDAHNVGGGCLSFKVNKPGARECWFRMACRLLGETVQRGNQAAERVCGMSITPKRTFCIVRLWCAEHAGDAREYCLDVPGYSSVMFKPHASV